MHRQVYKDQNGDLLMLLLYIPPRRYIYGGIYTYINKYIYVIYLGADIKKNRDTNYKFVTFCSCSPSAPGC